MEKTTKTAIVFGVLFFLTVAGFVVESGVQSNWWTVDVSIVEFEDYDPSFPDENGTVVAKLYKPVGASSSTPVPGVLAIHGYNNDKDVQRPHSIELSKRGIAVLAVDVLNHGDSDNVNRSTSNPTPFAALAYLKALDFVDETNIGVTGHSFGAINTYTIALADPTIKAIAPIAFGFEVPGSTIAFGISFYQIARAINPNLDILHVASWGEEFFRDANITIDQHVQNGLDALNSFLGISDAEYGETYGTFNSGATRVEMLKKTHPGQTHSRKSTVAITAFFLQSLSGYTEEQAYESINMGNTIYWLADLAGIISMAALIFSIVPLAFLLMNIKFFKEVAKPMPKYRESYAPKTGAWWIFGIVNASIGFVTYVFNTEYFYPDQANDVATWVFDGWMIGEFFWSRGIRIYTSMIGNSFLAFYVVNAGLMMLIVLVFWTFIYRPKRVGFYELGASYKIPDDELAEGQAKPKGWKVFGKTLLIALSLIGYMYLVTYGASFLNVEIRGPWAGLKVLTWARALEFILYYPGLLLFFIFNAGIWMFGMMRQKEYETEAKTIFIWWIKICIVMLSGLILTNLLQYVPMYLGLTGPWLNNWAFAPMNVLQLWATVPFAAGFYLILIIFYRKTGKIWLGSFIIPAIATWLLVGGYLMYPVPL
ncbi:MAG: alpha/beta fold hydrolase [Candidatus Lokiarchaeota archaeon]|nr:alpha/beta fold hydrolase [Candidatus Lokiarchaeota archaeon]